MLPAKLSAMMEMFYIRAAQNSSHQPHWQLGLWNINSATEELNIELNLIWSNSGLRTDAASVTEEILSIFEITWLYSSTFEY